MATIKNLIQTETDGSISFGDYELPAKKKLADFEHQGDIYKVKTVEGPKDAQITVEGESGTYYNVYLNNVERASQKTNLGGKLSFSVELANAGAVNVRIEKA